MKESIQMMPESQERTGNSPTPIRIEVYLPDGCNCWMARCEDPAWLNLFGSYELPTGYTRSCPAGLVVEHLRKNWAGRGVVIELDPELHIDEICRANPEM